MPRIRDVDLASVACKVHSWVAGTVDAAGRVQEQLPPARHQTSLKEELTGLICVVGT